MLILTRKPGQSIRVGDAMVVVLATSDKRCYLSVSGLPRYLLLGDQVHMDGGYISLMAIDDSYCKIGLSFPREVKIIRSELA